MTQLWLIRHGQTDWNLENRWQGQSPVAPTLNDLGRRQAEDAAGALAAADATFSALYSSDLARARDTAAIIGARLGLSPQFDARLREINQGAWEGMRPIDIARNFPDEWLASRAGDPLAARAPGGESAGEVAERFWRAMSAIAREHPGRAAIVVSHGYVLGTLIARLRGLPPDRAREHIPENGAPIVIDWDVGAILALRLSDTAAY